MLFLPVLLDRGWILLPVLPLVIGVGLTPFPLAVAHYVCILRVCGEFLAVILRATLTLASSGATHGLVGAVLRRLKSLLTIPAATRQQGRSPPGPVEMNADGDLRRFTQKPI
jgi:hypothetical protein